ncbi:hypothetical protein PGTUg99_010714 [Puccinia graminis f. sp. tritici]|uniref:Uncharacterized protein n=2 Tax=Puccinia graminis f. sp. tritici TaxID=56615 RepID=A0A5B0LI58_PUCGR|nr:hypothetical protein PGTUg99_010714 [Puccinia graminis f. sp. tritici]
MSDNAGSMDLSDSSLGEDDNISSSDVDAEVLESQLDRKKTRRRVKKKLTKEQKVISKIAESRPLPHPTGALSTSVTQFAKFMMGLESSSSPLPAPPTAQEISMWNNHIKNRRAHVSSRLPPTVNPNESSAPSPAAQAVSTGRALPLDDSNTSTFNPAVQGDILPSTNPTTKDNTRANYNFLRNETLNSIRQQGLQLTKYTPAPEISAHARHQPISSQTKQICDKEFQLKGFSRITFEWDARSLTSSPWNQATASILIDKWSGWYETQGKNRDNLKEDIEGILERWLTGTMRRNYRKQLTSRANAPPAVSSKHKRDRKKIAEHRYHAAKSVFPQNKRFTILFNDVACVSDYEDNADPALPRNRIIPRWRSEILTKVSHQLDIAAIQLQKPGRSRANLADLLRRGDSKNEPIDSETPMEPPRKFPIDSYDSAYLSELTALERSHIKPKEEINFLVFLESLYKLTVRGYMNTDQENVTNSENLAR